MARTPDAPETSTSRHQRGHRALARSSAAPLLRKAVGDIDEENPKTRAQQLLIGVFVFLPMVALIAAIPFAWGWGLNWRDILVAAVFYWVSGLGVTVGYHRYFTHSSFKAKPGLRVALAVAGSLAMEGPVVNWVADHRRHHKYSDKEGDPHSPWRYGDDAKALDQGAALGAHRLAVRPEPGPRRRSSRPTCSPTGRSGCNKLFPAMVAFSLLGPAVIGGFWTSAGRLVLARRHRGVLLGRPGPHHAAAPRDLVD